VVLKPELTQKYVLVGDDYGDVDESYSKKNSYRVEADYYSTKYFIQTQGNERREQEQYVVIHLTAKILESRYFEGITADNIELIYGKLMDQRVVSFALIDFMDATGCTDIDWKYDFGLMEGMKGEPIHIFKEFTQQLWSITQPKYKETTTRFPPKKTVGITSQGIQWNNRQSATPRKPFVKFYNKTLHIKHEKSMQGFADTYLTKEEAEAIRYRVEVTVKNKKAIKWHKIKGNTLRELLNISPQKKYDIITNSIKVYLVDTNPKPTNKREMKESWYIKFIARQMELLIKEKKPYAYIINYCTMDFDKHQRHKYKPVIDQMYDKYIAKESYAETPLEVSGWFNMLGLLK
jgi:hypothetical protein